MYVDPDVRMVLRFRRGERMRVLLLFCFVLIGVEEACGQDSVPPAGDVIADSRFLDAPCSGGTLATTIVNNSAPTISRGDRRRMLSTLPPGPSGAPAAATSAPCVAADFLGLDATTFAESVASADLACLASFWLFNSDVEAILTSDNVQGVAELLQADAVGVVLNADRLERCAFFLQIAFFHEFYQSTVSYTTTSTDAASVAMAFLGEQPALVSASPPLDLLAQWCVTIDSTDASHLAIDTLQSILERYLSDPAHELIFQERVIAYRVLFTLSRQIWNHYISSGAASPWHSGVPLSLAAAVESIALDLTYDDDTVYVINNALWVFNRLALLDSPTRDAAHVTLTQAYLNHQQYSAPWFRAVLDLFERFDGELTTGATLDFASIQSDVRALALPFTYTFDQGRIVFETAIDLDDAEALYDAVQEVESQFFRRGGELQPVPDDANESIRLVIYGSPADYATYQPFLFGLGTDNGGLFHEGWGILFTYDRTPAQSIYTLEELIRHEYTHYIDSRYLIVGSFGQAGTLYEGDRLVWYNEGLAEYMVGARRLGGVHPRSIVFETIAADTTRLTVAEIVSASYSQGFKFYRYAGAFFEFLEEERPQSLADLFDAVRGNDLAVLDALYLSFAQDPILQSDYESFLNAGISGLATAAYAEDVPTSAPPIVDADNAAIVAAELDAVLPPGDLYFWSNRYRYTYLHSVALGTETPFDIETGVAATLDGTLATLLATSDQHAAAVAWYGDAYVDGGLLHSTVVVEGTYRATAADSEPPMSPDGVSASAEINGVTIAWSSVSAVDVGGYHVYRASDPAGPFVRLNEIPRWSRSWLDTTPTTGTAYYAVTAVDASGNESALSEVVDAESSYRVLVVNGHFDSAAAGSFMSYRNAFDSIGVVHAAWDPFTDGPLTEQVLAEYTDGVVVWAVDYFHTGFPEQLGPDRQSLIVEYLDAGGSLLLSGAFVAAYLDDTVLFEQYVHVSHEQWSMEVPGLLGTGGHVVGDGLAFTLPSSVYASELSLTAPATAAFSYDPASGSGALLGDGVAVSTVEDGFRVGFLSFPFDALIQDDRETLLQRLVDWALPRPTCSNPFVRGDANGSGVVDVADAITLLDHLFSSGVAPTPVDSGDATSDGALDIADAIFVLTYLFAEGPAPAAPFPSPGCVKGAQ